MIGSDASERKTATALRRQAMSTFGRASLKADFVVPRSRPIATLIANFSERHSVCPSVSAACLSVLANPVSRVAGHLPSPGHLPPVDYG